MRTVNENLFGDTCITGDGMMIKRCTRCDREYPATTKYFYKEKRFKCGLQSWCKECVRIAAINHYRENREKCCETAKKYRQENPEKISDCKKKYCQDNREKISKKLKKYRQTFRGFISQLVINIKQRCTNPKTVNYKNYGARGIKCEFTFNGLYNYLVSSNIDPRGLQIHRINNDGNYTLKNIEFLDRDEHRQLHEKGGKQ